MQDLKINAERFMGFADVYDNSRPQPPQKVKEIITRYLGRTPQLVVDLGCGTGLSSFIWCDASSEVIGIEPSPDMIKKANEKAAYLSNIRFVSGYSDHTGLENECADVITCSQSFHWMNPESTLFEVSRILRPRGVFAVYDCDWPPVISWEAEREYNALLGKVGDLESSIPELKNKYRSWPKDNHLSKLKNSGVFQYVREIVFSNTEQCDASRFINIALSQGGIQTVLKAGIKEFEPYMEKFKQAVTRVLSDKTYSLDFCYRMRIGIKAEAI